MQRRIDNCYRNTSQNFRATDRLDDSIIISLVYRGWNTFQDTAATGIGFRKNRYGLGILGSHQGCNGLVMGRCNLRTIAPIDFITVVGGGIMACRDDYSSHSFQVADCKGKHGDRMQGIVKINMYTQGSQRQGALPGKDITVVTTVVGYNDGGCLPLHRQHVPAQCTGQASDYQSIHPVGSATDNSPHPCGPKAESSIKALMEFGPVLGIYKGLDLITEYSIGLSLAILPGLHAQLCNIIICH